MDMLWWMSWCADPVAVRLADRHYSRQNPGSNQFMPPGRKLVLRTLSGDAVWGTSWPFAEYVKRQHFPAAWVCTIFRNESPHLSSEMILQAIAATRAVFGEPPADGMVTMVDAGKVRRKRDPGRCFRKAGFIHIGETKDNGLLVFHLAPEHMPTALMPHGAQLSLVEAVS